MAPPDRPEPALASAPPAAPDIFDETCSARHALELVASKWSVLILSALADGPTRNATLLCRIGGISQKMLAQTLRDLERNGLVLRQDFHTARPCVEYRLSPLGESLSETLTALDRWAEHNFPALDAAREAFDAREEE
jgi:DNA-binding HxlR family transcriptional regulator